MTCRQNRGSVGMGKKALASKTRSSCALENGDSPSSWVWNRLGFSRSFFRFSRGDARDVCRLGSKVDLDWIAIPRANTPRGKYILSIFASPRIYLFHRASILLDSTADLKLKPCRPFESFSRELLSKLCVHLRAALRIFTLRELTIRQNSQKPCPIENSLSLVLLTV